MAVDEPDASGPGDPADSDEATPGGTDPARLLAEVRSVRRSARLARHAYWFPLVLFGVLVAASIPFYVIPAHGRFGVFLGPVRSPDFVSSSYLGGWGMTSAALPYYWLAAILAGLAGTVAWYRWHGGRAGIRTPARGYLITGLVLVVLALAVPFVTEHVSVTGTQPPWWSYLMPGDLLIRGTFPLVIIAIGLCVLAWAERSIVLSVIAAGYLALSLVASLYDIVNVLARLGWYPGAAASQVPNVALPALVLLLSGAGAFAAQRRRQRRPEGAAPRHLAGPAGD